MRITLAVLAAASSLCVATAVENRAVRNLRSDEFKVPVPTAPPSGQRLPKLDLDLHAPTNTPPPTLDQGFRKPDLDIHVPTKTPPPTLDQGFRKPNLDIHAPTNTPPPTLDHGFRKPDLDLHAPTKTPPPTLDQGFRKPNLDIHVATNTPPPTLVEASSRTQSLDFQASSPTPPPSNKFPSSFKAPLIPTPPPTGLTFPGNIKIPLVPTPPPTWFKLPENVKLPPTKPPTIGIDYEALCLSQDTKKKCKTMGFCKWKKNQKLCKYVPPVDAEENEPAPEEPKICQTQAMVCPDGKKLVVQKNTSGSVATFCATQPRCSPWGAQTNCVGLPAVCKTDIYCTDTWYMFDDIPSC